MNALYASNAEEKAQIKEELNLLFASNTKDGLEPDVLNELESIMRLHNLPAQELFYKWESYSIKMMSSDDIKLDIETVRAIKADLNDSLERESRSRAHIKTERRTAATPRQVKNSDDIFGMLDGLVPGTSGSGSGSNKRKAAYQTPSISRTKLEPASSPPDFKTPIRPSEPQNSAPIVPFSSRQDAGKVIEHFNEHLPAFSPPIAPFPQPRVKLVANSDIKKLSYKPLAMKMSEASEILDDRIDDFIALVQDHHNLPDSAFGSAAEQSVQEIVAVGRIASDSSDGRLNPASLVLETSRRTGSGLRVPLRMSAIQSYVFFPGQIVALRGTNAAGTDFAVSQILDMPGLPAAASIPQTIDEHLQRLRGDPNAMDSDTPPAPLNMLAASGPYTADDNLLFEPLHELCSLASTVDVLLLTGPFLDTTHPLLASGDFGLPSEMQHDADTDTLKTAFRAFISAPLQQLAKENPSITILMIPSVRDATSAHVSWPQEPLQRSGLGLPKHARLVGNPMTMAINEITFGISSQDILSELRASECIVGATPGGLLARLPKHLIEQRHFFPLHPPLPRSGLPKTIINGVEEPAPGACLDTSYLKLGEMLNIKPDVLVIPSSLPPFVKVVESVLVINPGSTSKRRGAGTYVRMSVEPMQIGEAERRSDKVGHGVWERAKVEVVRI